VAVFTNDNPRSEDPWAVLTAMVGGVLTVPEDERAHVIVEPDRVAAIALAVGRARRGDVVLVAGKGHEQGQYIAGEVLPFDDREVVRRALRERRTGKAGDAKDTATDTAAGNAADEEQS
jgi:UDP-N-acetylmuramoyl-L-alanyl-D-glutamate--2,6-diaminopimelate ligase